eukprot:SAG25_NODE_164_length_13142_cov_11.645787_8_plen_56_part_00
MGPNTTYTNIRFCLTISFSRFDGRELCIHSSIFLFARMYTFLKCILVSQVCIRIL